MVIVITGDKCAGKSSVLINIAEKAKKKKLSVAGFISSRIWQDGKRYGYNLINLTENSEELLAVEGELEDDVFKYCAFSFRNKAVENGNKAIEKGLYSDLLIIDEIGNMEIDGGGWGKNIPLLAKRKLPTIIGMRTNVADKFTDKFGIAIDKIITVDPENKDIAEKIAEEYLYGN